MQSDKLEFLQGENKIVIIGLAASGKTMLTDKVAELLPDHDVIHSDDYIQFGFENSLYKMISDIKMKGDAPLIIEGVQAFRLLRKGLQNMDFLPDVIVNTYCSDETRLSRYEARGNSNSITTFDKALFTIWKSYKDLLDANPDVKRPRFLNISTE